LEVTKERLKYAEEKFFQQGQALEKALLNLGRLETDVKRTSEERNDLKTELEITKQKLKYAEQALAQYDTKTIEKSRNARRQAFLASLIFLIASVLASAGINMLTSTPPISLGWLIISLAIMAYIVAALMTTLLASGGNN
jgi:Skp family chaperone for outer membrane proteins